MKKQMNKKLARLAITAAMLLGMAMTSLAGTSSKTVVSHVGLHFDTSDIEIGSASKNIIVEADNGAYDVNNDEGSAMNLEGGKWKSGMTPKFKVVIRADSDYRFDTSALKNSSYYTLNGSEVTFVKASGSSSSITLTVKMKKLKGVAGDLGVSDLEWSDESGKAEWMGADNAEKYMLKLYRGSKLVWNGETTGTSYDFGSVMTSTGNYTFKVRAYAYGSYGEWDSSDELELTSVPKAGRNNGNSSTPAPGGQGNSSSNPSNGGNSTVISGSGSWIKDNVGWWYLNPDRSYPANTWKFINGKWYYFNASGYMGTGWIKDGKLWYYCGQDGALYINTVTPDGYRVDGSGAWIQ